MLKVGLQLQLRKRIAQESNQFSFRKVYNRQIRELLEKSILNRSTVKNLSDMRRLIVTRELKRKSISAEKCCKSIAQKNLRSLSGRTSLLQSN